MTSKINLDSSYQRYKYLDIDRPTSKFKNRSAFVMSKCALVFKLKKPAIELALMYRINATYFEDTA